MGTSVNQHSPDIPSWRLARALLGNSEAAPADQVAELWRAAVADRSRALQSELSDALLARAAGIAREARSAQEALADFDDTVLRSRTCNFAVELGRRALARAALAGTGAEGFAAELFAEATSYYVARDLPGFVGSKHRVQTAHEALDLKHELQQLARTAAATRRVSTDAKKWPGYVQEVIGRLTKHGRKR
jgi:hypothetical protein